MPGSSARRAGVTAVELRHTHPQTRASRSLAIGDLVLGTSDWIYSLALVILVYRLTGSVAWVAGVLLFQAVGRLVTISFCSWFGDCARNRYATFAGLGRPLLIASLLLVSSDAWLWWAIAVAGLMGASGAVDDAARSSALPPPAPARDASLFEKALMRSDQIAMIAGAILGGLLIVAGSEYAAFIIAALAGAITALVVAQAPRLSLPTPAAGEARAGEPRWRSLSARPAFRRVVLALAAGAALGIALRVILVDVVLGEYGSSELVYALMIAFAGVGTLYSPVSVPRLLGKLGPELVLAGTVVALACALVFVHIARPLVILVPVVFGCGMLAMTGERVAQTLTRRLVPDSDLDEALRMLAAAAVAGQALALAALLAVAPSLNNLVAVFLLAGVGIMFAAVILKGSLAASLQRVRNNDLDERRPARR